jgi:LacI family transcriptional regulator
MLTLLQRAGLRVPEDISLIGYDNLTRSAAVYPPLTTIDGALDQQIQAALRLLTQTDPPSKTRSIIVLPTLIRRESTAAPSC